MIRRAESGDIGNAGCEPVPHIAARRLASAEALEERVRRFAHDAGAEDILVIAGSSARLAGMFTSTLDVLETGCLDRDGIKRISRAGHPKGSPDCSEKIARRVLRLKRAFVGLPLQPRS